MQLAHQFKRIKLNLARSKAFPVGSDLHGYEFVAPLDPHGHIDSKLWKEQREQCRVRRFWNGNDEQTVREYSDDLMYYLRLWPLDTQPLDEPMAASRDLGTIITQSVIASSFHSGHGRSRDSWKSLRIIKC